MESVFESELSNVLYGKAVASEDYDLPIDKRKENEKLVTKMNVCYIVCGILINEKQEILMMQEAKTSCYGLWYLPAGRMEVNENIEEAVQREVLEETGIEFKPTSLIVVEMACGYWYRFTFIGVATGGKLKSYEQRDKESIQAEWMSLDKIKSKEITLRAKDILPLINYAMQHHSAISKFSNTLPQIVPRNILAIRLLLFCQVEVQQMRQYVMMCTKSSPHLPLIMIKLHDSSFTDVLMRSLKGMFGNSQINPSVHGVLSVEHCGKPASAHDGMIFSVLVSVPGFSGLPTVTTNTDIFQWHLVQNNATCERLHSKLKSNMCIPLYLLSS